MLDKIKSAAKIVKEGVVKFFKNKIVRYVSWGIDAGIYAASFVVGIKTSSVPASLVAAVSVVGFVSAVSAFICDKQK